MKYLKIAILVIYLLFPVASHAEPYPKTTTLVLMALYDNIQTMEILYGHKLIRNKDGSITTIYHDGIELNPFLSDKPSQEELLIFGAVGIGVFLLFEKFMEESIFKDILLDSVLATEKKNIEWNQIRIDKNKRPAEELAIVIQLNGTF